MGIKRLFFDIETSYMLVKTHYIGRKVFLDHRSIVRPAKIICICWKWEHKKKIESLTWDSKQDDKRMIEKFIKIANSADEIVAQNGDRFDLPWIRTRCIYHRIPMFPDYTTIDTLKASRSKFRFASNRLDFVGGYLGIGNKEKAGEELWDKITLENCQVSLKKMVRYCKRDVILLDGVFKIMNPYLVSKTHYGVMIGKDKRSCPECGSDNVRKMVNRVSAAGVKKSQYQCQGCGKYHTITENRKHGSSKNLSKDETRGQDKVCNGSKKRSRKTRKVLG